MGTERAATQANMKAKLAYVKNSQRTAPGVALEDRAAHATDPRRRRSDLFDSAS